MAERLSFKTDETPYNSVIAAEHLGRYAMALNFCKGKSVLDIACGEGYGSAILADGGASSVLGVDSSAEAIASAKSIFSRPNVSFVMADALDVNAWNPDNKKFDVIVCYETIEHVSSPETLLKIFHQVLAPQGTILISCPNDHIDIKHGESNPFHIRPYTFEEYQGLTTNILGEADQWLLGTPLTGMAILDTQSDFLSSNEPSIQQMNCFISITDTLFLPAQTGHSISPRNSSFYLGIWNGQAKTQLICAPMSRSAYLDPWYSMLSAIKERDDKNENVTKLEKLVQLSEQRTETIRRISSFESERLKEYNAIMKFELSNYKFLINNYSRSRAHRIAALYTREATGNNAITKTLQFSKAALFSAWRAIVRRFNR